MISQQSLQIHKPFYSDVSIASYWQFYKRINWVWWLIRIPMLLLALPSAYGVGAFAGEYLPSPWHQLAGMAFESAYIGAIAIADQQVADDPQMRYLWWLVNLFAVIFSVLSNLLFFAGGSYSQITPEIVTHAVPNAVLGFLYSLLVHEYTTQLANKHRKEFMERPYSCKHCGARYARIKQLNGHMAQCTMSSGKSKAQPNQ